MRKRLIAAFLLVVAAIVLGSTVFREQVVNAATTPFQSRRPEHEHEPGPVTQVGTSTTSVTGTVGIDPSKNTVNLGHRQPDDRREHLANIENAGSATSTSTAAATSRRRPARRRRAR